MATEHLDGEWEMLAVTLMVAHEGLLTEVFLRHREEGSVCNSENVQRLLLFHLLVLQMGRRSLGGRGLRSIAW